jgi:hypothetical protein
VYTGFVISAHQCFSFTAYSVEAFLSEVSMEQRLYCLELLHLLGDDIQKKVATASCSCTLVPACAVYSLLT